VSSWLVRRVAGRAPTLVLVAAAGLEGLVRLAIAVARRPWALTVVSTAVVVVALHWWALVPLGVVSASLLGLGLARPAVLRSWWRGRHYRRRWAEAMLGCKLVHAGVEPTLMRVTSLGGLDRLEVHLAPGQLVDEWREAVPRLRSAFEVRSVRVRRDGPRDVVLLARWRDPDLVELEASNADADQLEAVDELEPPSAFPRSPR